MCGVYVHTHWAWAPELQSPISSDVCTIHSSDVLAPPFLSPTCGDKRGLTVVWIPVKSVRNGSRSRAVTPTVMRCLHLDSLNTSLLFFLCVLFIFSYETELEVSRPLGALHRVFKEGRCVSQLPLHLLCTLERPNCSETHSTNHCQCLLHHQDQHKQTSGKRFPFLPCSLRWGFDENRDFSCQGHWWAPSLWNRTVIFLSSSRLAHLQHLP